MDASGRDNQREPTQGRRFCFTLNNPTPDERAQVEVLQLTDDLRLLVIGDERGVNGTPHMQGYMETIHRMRFGGLRARWPFLERAALFVSRGSRKQAFDYCIKDGNILIQIGIPPKSDQRSDLDSIKASIDSGVSELELANEAFTLWCRYRKAFSAYRNLKVNSEQLPKEVLVFIGPTGCGKTRKVFESERVEDLWIWSIGCWFDGYAGQTACLFDDFAADSGIPFRLFLRVLDRYPIQLPIKGGFTQWCPRRIYITSNMLPDHWYPTERGIEPLYRRITSIERFDQQHT